MAKPQKQEQENESVASILSKIKSMVSGKEKIVIDDEAKAKPKAAPAPKIEEEDEEAFELVEMVEIEEPLTEGSSAAESLIPEENVNNMNTGDISAEADEPEKFVDLLQEIDQALEAEYNNPTKNTDIAAEPVVIQAAQPAPVSTSQPQAPVVETQAATPSPEPEVVVPSFMPNANVAQAVPQNKPEPVIESRKQFTENISPDIITPRPMETEKRENILSQDIAARSSKAIQGLLNNLPRPDVDSPAFRNATTIEDLVMESMKPLLKEWLDKNLEVIVRDIVEREIKKIMPRE